MSGKRSKKTRNKQITAFILLILIVVLTPLLSANFSMVPLIIVTIIVGMVVIYIVGKLTKEV